MKFKLLLVALILILVSNIQALAQSGTAYRVYGGTTLPLNCRKTNFSVDIFIVTGSNSVYICVNPVAAYPSNWGAIVSGGAGTGDVVGPAASVDNELVLYNSTTGKLLKRATGNGFVFSTSGVASFIAGNGTGNVVLTTNAALVTPNLGTPSAINLTNGTSLPIAGISGLATGIGTFFATPTSANLAAAITNETGSGLLVFNTSPTFVTPVLGAATGTSLSLGGNAVPTAANHLGFFAATTSAQLAAIISDEEGVGNLLFGIRTGTTNNFATQSGSWTAGRCVEINGSGNLIQSAGGCGGSGSPGGSDTQVQFNNAGSFAGDAGMTYNSATDTLTVGTLITTGSGYNNFASQSDSTTEGDIWRNANLFKFRGSASTFTFATLEAANTFTADVSVPDESYDATNWNGSVEVPTKNAIRDKLESMGGGGGSGTTTSKDVISVVGGCKTGATNPDHSTWYRDAALPATIACRGNTFEYAAMSFSELATAYIPIAVPSEWTSGAVTLTLYGTNGGAETGDTLDVSTLCIANGEGFDTPSAFNTAQTITFNTTTAGLALVLTQSSLTMTGCAADENLIIKLKRTDPENVNFFLHKAKVRFVIP